MERIYEGILGETPFYVTKLQMQHLPAIEKLQQEVYEALPDQSILQPLTTEEFEFILQGNGLMIGAYVDKALIGFRALLNPPIENEHLGYDCGIAEDQFHRVLYQEISNVSPHYRGYGLQKTLATIVMNEIDLDSYDYVCSTVKPFNIPSLKDKFSQGLVIKGLKIKYVDKLRYIFYKNLQQEQPVYTEKKAVLMRDTTLQQQLLKEGYTGTAMYEEQNDWFVVFER
ncbi:GNAT family N-acetyltransferase [Lysinibacillus sp. CD3-6]|uniref:GNAT family N-acetyltransferase n=1 Tax=Lysinibacillus sp. CD3-6 TaxID=2892541 RepID=UPI00116F4570|nr:GNAT family N-acetyltransferase [Lysinibacillus sp. CD3-6]UED80635.1 GNAT family N-acetyltransferase [Lysinibacillus sp. CD3-6]